MFRIRIQSGQWIQEGKNYQQKRKFRNAGCSLLCAEGLFYSLDVLYDGLGIGKLQFVNIKILIFFSCNFFQFLGIKTLTPDRYPAENAGL